MGTDTPGTRARWRAFVQAFWVGVGFTAYAWLFACVRGGSLLPAGATSALFLCLLAGALIGIALGTLWALGSSTAAPARRVADRLARAVAEPEVVGLAMLGQWYSGWLLSCAGAGASFYLVRHAVLSIARPENVALTVVASELGLVLCAFVTFHPLADLVRSVLAKLSARLQSRRLLDVRGHLALLTLLTIAVSCTVGFRFRQTLVALDWAPLGSSLSALIASVATQAGLSRTGFRPRLALGVSMLTVFVVSGIWAARAEHHSPAAAARASEHVVQARWGLSALTLLCDWDRDGHIGSFGGNDCAPFDRVIHPGALEVPGNGVDEDCDGADLVRSPVMPRRGGARQLLPNHWARSGNLYLFSIDAFASGVLSSYGGTQQVMPNLERLARRSVVFRHYFSQGPSTRLSLPSLFTSRFDSQIQRVVAGRFPFELSQANLTLAEVLTEQGYVTGAILPHPYFTGERWRGLTQGFAHVDDTPARAHSNETPHTARLVTDRAVAFTERFDERPLFLWAHYFDAHPPHDPFPGHRPSAGELAAYLTEIAHVDRELGRLLDHVLEHDPEPFIVITGDHGIAFDEPRHRHVRYGHDLSTAVLRVPLLIYAPTLKPARLDDLVNGLDLAPTLTEQAGVSRPLPFIGRSLLPRSMGTSERLAGLQFAQLYLPEELLRGGDPLKMVSVRNDQYNLVLDRHSGKLEAWNWRSDPTELHDLWSRHARQRSPEAAELRALKASLDNFVIDSRLANGSAPPRIP